MPNYGYKCECGNEFEEYVHTRAQAECNKATPNNKRAVCSKCHKLADRNLNGTRLYKYGGNLTAMVADLKPTPDPVYDGKLSINAGRNYGLAVNLGPAQPQIGQRCVLWLHYMECDCEFCKEGCKPVTDEIIKDVNDFMNILAKGA